MPVPQPNSNRIVVGITGHIGAGKTTAGQYLRSNYGFYYVRYSQMLSDWFAKDSGLEPDLQEIGWQVMAKSLQGELNRRLIAQMESDRDVAVNGLRHPLDFESLRSAFGSAFHLLFLDSPQRLRWERKNVKAKYRSFEAFQRADSHPVEQQIESLRLKAALVIRNEDSLQDLHTAMGQAIRKSKGVGQA